MDVPYKVECENAELPVAAFLNGYVDEAKFLACCQRCPNYKTTWSCPPYDFSPVDYWQKYNRIKFLKLKMVFDSDMTGKSYSQEEIDSIIENSLKKEKAMLMDQLLQQEKETPDSISLSAGSCDICGPGNCRRLTGEPCAFPEKMRYSVEALGGDVNKIVSQLFDDELLWAKEGKLPEHYILVGGLLVV